MLCFGICDSDMEIFRRAFHYTACAEVDSFDAPECMETQVVSKGNYMVYTYSGAIKDLGEFYNDIFTKFIPASGYEMDFRPQIELYDERDL